MSKITDCAIETLRAEAEAIAGLEEKITVDFEHAVKAMLGCKGKVIVTGMGKSGIIGRKIAATLASTGTSSFFIHPGEAYHGDLGMIGKEDIVIALSSSGTTDEVLKLIPYLQENGNTIISITGNPQSPLARNSCMHLNASVAHEACPLSLAPTCSTTAMLALGDALAVALMNERNFRAEDFARFHPGGSLGRRLLTKVGDVMRKEDLPMVEAGMKLSDAIIVISNARLGVAIIMEENAISGIITDGDIRRAMQKHKEHFFDLTVEEAMTRTPKKVLTTDRITDAEEVMHKHKIHSLIVTHENGELAGIIELYDLMRSN